ncbi:MAG: AMP-binding protein, partial [Candidatus Omnitrophica bacterium]|nr:AMP-binding protein [Candidatus Omnitrophota bacterium]MBD3269526.1 AMP-binding protein [Candidatus Omnitrophota bacterium]
MSNENLTLPEIFDRVTSQYSSNIFCKIVKENSTEEVTFGRLRETVLKTAGLIRREGAKEGDYIVLLAGNRFEWAVCYFAIISLGAVAVPLNPEYSGGEIKNLLLSSEAKILITSAGIYKKKINEEVRKDLNKIILLDGEDTDAGRRVISFSETNGIEPLENFYRVKPQDCASLI